MLVQVTCLLVTAVSALTASSLIGLEDIPFGATLPGSRTLMRAPKWSNGSLITVSAEDMKSPPVWIFTRNGYHSIPISIPDAQLTSIYDWDRGADGTIALSGGVVDGARRVYGFLARVSPSGGPPQVIRTGDFRPALVTIASDGSLWTVGTERFPRDSQVVRRYDRSGNLAGSFVPYSTIKEPITLARSRNTLRALPDRIAWYSVDGRYVEFSLTGEILTDIAVELPSGEWHHPEIGFAITDNGDAFLSAPDINQPASGYRPLAIYKLDRSAKAWTPIVAGPAATFLFGAEGNSLVTAVGKSARISRVVD